jgi:hypothetical protein
VVILLEGHRSLGVLAIWEYDRHENLRGSGRRSVISYVRWSSLGTALSVVAAAGAAGAEGPSDRRAAAVAMATEVAGEGSPVRGQAPSFTAGAKRAAAPSGSSPPAK